MMPPAWLRWADKPAFFIFRTVREIDTIASVGAHCPNIYIAGQARHEDNVLPVSGPRGSIPAAPGHVGGDIHRRPGAIGIHDVDVVAIRCRIEPTDRQLRRVGWPSRPVERF